MEINGLAYSRSTRKNLEGILNKVIPHEADLMDFGSVFSVLEEVRPDVIFHLAAFANVRASFDTPNSFLGALRAPKKLLFTLKTPHFFPRRAPRAEKNCFLH